MRPSYFFCSPLIELHKKFAKIFIKVFTGGDRHVTIKTMMRKVGKFGGSFKDFFSRNFFSQATCSIIEGLGAEASARAHKKSL